MNETNQTEDLSSELNEENPKLNEEENPKDELHEDLNQLRILSDELKNTREPSWVSLETPRHISTKHNRVYQHCPQ